MYFNSFKILKIDKKRDKRYYINLFFFFFLQVLYVKKECIFLQRAIGFRCPLTNDPFHITDLLITTVHSVSYIFLINCNLTFFKSYVFNEAIPVVKS